MRLAQLARKLGIRSADIVEFLAGHQYAIEDSFNAKLSKLQVELIIQNFSPHGTHDIGTVDTSPIGHEEDQPLPEANLDLSELPNETGKETASTEANTEVIRAYKVALPGLKVVGKIALPEAKATTSDKKSAVTGKEFVSLDQGRRKKLKPSQQENRPRKNPVAIQRQREEREARERKEAKKREEKELRTKRYQEKVSKYTQPPKPISALRNEDYEVYEEPKRQPPKTWMGKIAGWFVSD